MSLSLHPAQPFHLPNSLTLTPRIKLNLTIYPSNPNTSPLQLDIFKLKQTLITFFKSSLSITVPHSDVTLKRVKDLKNRKRVDPAAEGSVVVRDLERVEGKSEAEFEEWRKKKVVEKVDGMEVNIEGVGFRVKGCVPKGDEFLGMKKEWEEYYAFRDHRGSSRSGRREPDTMILRGVPSRWFAEPRVSSKPSLLVTHTIFSNLGKIRNLDVAEDDESDRNADEDTIGLIKGLHCKVVVQFEEHKDFCNALKAFCGRSMQKQGSQLKVDYEVTWVKDGYFRSSTHRTQDRSNAPRHQLTRSPSSPDNVRRKRFKE